MVHMVTTLTLEHFRQPVRQAGRAGPLASGVTTAATTGLLFSIRPGHEAQAASSTETAVEVHLPPRLVGEVNVIQIVWNALGLQGQQYAVAEGAWRTRAGAWKPVRCAAAGQLG